jgi:hypothetical protein
MSIRVFISYSTGDGDWAARLIFEELSTRFGANEVFPASGSIMTGDEFTRAAQRQLTHVDALLAVIGSRWEKAADEFGVRRLDKADDYVRHEIRTAFAHKVRVIPVLLDDRAPLLESNLPEDIAALAHCQYLRLHRCERDVAALVDTLTILLPPDTGEQGRARILDASHGDFAHDPTASPATRAPEVPTQAQEHEPGQLLVHPDPPESTESAIQQLFSELFELANRATNRITNTEVEEKLRRTFNSTGTTDFVGMAGPRGSLGADPVGFGPRGSAGTDGKDGPHARAAGHRGGEFGATEGSVTGCGAGMGARGGASGGGGAGGGILGPAVEAAYRENDGKREHKYLYRVTSDEYFADDRLVPPPVIGEDPSG